MGYLAAMLVPFEMFGAPIAAAVNDRSGSYEPAIWGFTLACGLAALALLPLRMPERPGHPLPS